MLRLWFVAVRMVSVGMDDCGMRRGAMGMRDLFRRLLDECRNESGLDIHMRGLGHRRRRWCCRRVGARVRAVAPVGGGRSSRRHLGVRAVVIAWGLVRPRVNTWGLYEGHDGVVVRENVGLVEGELIVEHIEEFALYPAYVAFAENACAERPVDVLECGVIAVLVSEDERSQEYTLAGPLLKGDLEVWLRPVHVCEGNEDNGDFDFGLCEDVVDKVDEVCVVVLAGR